MNQVRQRSAFVTVVAWVFIVLSGFGTLISALQNVMVFTMFDRPEFGQAMQAPPPPGMPPVAAFLLAHFQLVVLALLLVSVFALVCSIGLLRRWNWARLCFIGLMVAGIVWNLANLAFQVSVFSAMREQIAVAAASGAPDMRPFLVATAVIGVLMAVGFSVLFGWIARRLLSAPVAAEFAR